MRGSQGGPDTEPREKDIVNMSRQMENQTEDAFNEGIILPNLISHLRKILDQYPDDTQIFKELIQNAEDAGARQIKFLYDQHTFGRDPKQLVHPGLARFQGPALYAYNDALFTEQDWKGVRMLSESIKQDDPTKVGYFGMGFKSVFHLTDLPSILSGSRLGVIDPHCSFFPASAYAWNLSRGGAELLQKHPHQVEPYIGVFDCTRASFREGHYNGTLFRFPLRTAPSLLAETTYDKENMTALYDSFQDDAHLVLLFLNHLESVELYTRDTNSRSAKLVFSVRIAKSCVDTVRQKRQAFLNQVKAGRRSEQPIVCTYALTLETVRQQATEQKRVSYCWLVTNYYCGGQVSAIFRKLQNDPELKFPSWVGTAMPLDVTGVGEDIYELNDDDGHVFCFLPLPHDRDASTGLPVHVNGFFALEQNRKYIRWPSATQTREELMNKSLLWNQCMLGEALPRAYARMLLHAIDVFNAGKDSSLTPYAIYRAFPDFEKVDRRWHVVLANVYSELFNHAVIHTIADGCSWVRTQDAIFNTLERSEEAYDVIQRVLALNDIKVSDVPAHVLTAVRRCCHINLGKITPAIVSNAFRNIQGNASFPWEDRMLVLRYLLKPGKFDLLDGLELLPIANGGFRTLHSNPRRAEGPVYLGSPDHPQTLLPGLDDDLMDIDIDQDVLDMLRNAAVKGYTQVKLLTSTLIAELLPACLPAEWRDEQQVTWDPSTHGHPPKDWLEALWLYLARHCPNDLNAYEELPLIPMSAGSPPLPLTRLTTNVPVIVRSLDGLCMADGLDRVLTKIGVTVIDELPVYAKSLPLVCRLYVFAPTYIGVTRALLRLSLHGRRALREKLLRHTDDDDKRKLRETLAKISPREMQPEYKQLLSVLPLFEVASGDGTGERWVSRDEIDVAAPHEMPPVPVSRQLIDVSGAGSGSLATCLGVKRLSTVELLTDVVFPDLEDAYYESEDVEKLMVYVLRHYHFFCEEDAEFPRKLAALPFLPRKDLLLTANRFYDPVHETLQRIFWREDSFPTGVYGEPAMVAVLREIGLRGMSEVESEDLLESAYQVQDLSEDESVDAEKVVQKSDALLAFLQQNVDMLDSDCQGEPLCQCLADIRWVRRMSTKPAWYPNSLGWHVGEGAFDKPSELTVRAHASLVGSVVPVVANDVRGRLCDAFAWTQSPAPAAVARHFANTVAAYNGAEKAKFIQMAISVYTQLSRGAAAEIRSLLREQGLTDWVWHGEGFASPESLVFTEPFMDLRPFVYSLPTEMLAFTDFFQEMDVRSHCHLPSVLRMIKTKYESGDHSADVKRDLHTCVSILNEIKSSVTEETLTTLQEQLFLPIHQKAENTIRMAALDQCTYCDQEWLRQGFNMGDLDDDDDGLQFVHPNLPSSTAEALGVPSLMGRMLDAEELDFSFGQSDSLTHRLHTLLQEYTDGFAVPKELVQNADDAGATIVKILYDERRNDDARSCLIDDGMAECQGPALWAYNNAMFTDADFENITKLNGATKAMQTDKIGRFGLGFNAVYNLTDVPSFVSRHSVVIFDPHTTHLGRSIKNKAKPGIRIDVQKHKRKLRRLGNQFKPYNDVFGCNLRPDAYQESYNGTLFRFPLRTRAQAIRSEICQKHYDDREVKALLNLLVSRAESLLLFTQNVVQVSLYHLAANARDASNPAEVFSVSKAPIRILRELRPLPELPRTARHLSGSMQQLVRNSGVLKSSTAALEQIRSGASTRSAEMPNAALILRVESSTTAEGERLLRRKRNHMSRAWLVSSRMGTGSSLQMALANDDGLLPTAAVAVPLRPAGNDDSYTPVALTMSTDDDASGAGQHGGAVFTYMPLPVRSGLPVHVNGAFAIGASRRYLCVRNEDDKCDSRAAWNEALLGDCAVKAYVSLLEDVVLLAPADYTFHAVWPRASGVDANMRSLLVAFYRVLAGTRPDSPRLFTDGDRYVAVSDAHFLEPDLQASPVGPHAMRILKECLGSSGGTVVNLPDGVRAGFREAGVDGVIAERSYDAVRLFKTVLLPMILQVDADDRDTLVLYALSAGNPDVLDAIRDSLSVPVSPNGETLKSPSQLVDPTSELASLYSPEDGRFPHGSYVRQAALAALRTLGMAMERITWGDLVERAESVSRVDRQVARRRVTVILSLLQRKLEKTAEDETPDPQDITDLKNADFLPMKSRPQQFGLRWAGDDYADDVLLPATQLFPADSEELVCCVAPVVDDAVFPKGDSHLKVLLGLSDKCPSLDQVLAQLHELVHPSAEEMLADRQRQPQLQRMLYAVYGFLQTQCVASVEAREKIGDALSDKTFLLCHNRLLPPSKVAFEFAHASACAPYMYGLPEPLKRNFGDMLQAVGVRRRFETADFVSALHEMREAYGDTTLDRDTLRLALQLVNLLNESMAELDQTLHDVVDDHGAIFIPDARCVLRPSAELCFSEPDCQWVPTGDSVNYSHPLIPFTISKQLGVNTRRQEVLRKHSRGIGFGQKERLTTRIKRILSGYPCDKEILKELLQNADDAGSTEVHFIADRRRHRAERIFDESWRPLQGPALCVYNDRPFSETDLLGIQRLGEGSKSSDPNKTGQYGVGFNCVYHLTDVPSFLTCGPEIGETLCIFDPHAKYVPGASVDEPGRRYEDVAALRDIFTDIFPCYLEDKFPVIGATMFRFPLRDGAMAAESELCDRAFTPEMLDGLLTKFKPEIFDCLLFVNSVKSVTLTDVDPRTGNLKNTFTVTAELTEEDERVREEFSEFLRHVAEEIHKGNMVMEDVPVKEASYVLDLSDNQGYWEKWLVTQRVGFEPGTSVPKAVVDAFRRRELALLPRGGVAALLDSSDSGAHVRSRKAFCFLPLPVKLDLPMNVNAHFALDHESRRNLWYDEDASAKSEWNRLLLEEVVAPAYATTLRRCVPQLSCSTADDSMSWMSIVDAEVPNVDRYTQLFPRVPTGAADVYWGELARSVYRHIDEQQAGVLPVVRLPDRYDDNERAEIEWLPTRGSGEAKPYFDNLDETLLDVDDDAFGGIPGGFTPRRLLTSTPKKTKSKASRLRAVLLACGFKLVKLPSAVYDAFVSAGVHVECVSPSSVVSFFATYGRADSPCVIPTLPIAVSNTPLSGDTNLAAVLDYCLLDPDAFHTHVDGLPVLLTADEQLRVFDRRDPVFVSRYQVLLPSCSTMFVQRRLVETDTFGRVSDADVFAQFDICALASLLGNSLPPAIYCSGRPCYVLWRDSDEDACPNGRWLRTLWEFLRDEYERHLAEQCDEFLDERALAAAMLQPLKEWCILPAKQGGDLYDSRSRSISTMDDNGEQYLVPVGMAVTIVDLRHGGVVNASMKRALRMLGVPELNSDLLDGTLLSPVGKQQTKPGRTISSFARMLVAGLDRPDELLQALCHSVQNVSTARPLQQDDCNVVLKYFNDTLDEWREKPDCVERLRSLPLFLTVHGSVVRLGAARTYVFPNDVPVVDTDAWQRHAGVVFLRRNPLLGSLHDALDCPSLSASDVYAQFILRDFDYLSATARIAHLEHVRDALLPRLRGEEREALVENLQELYFLEDTSGVARRACDFYDPYHPVFRCMLSTVAAAFPPTPFDGFAWRDFMHVAGMRRDVDVDKFIEFVTDVADEATRYPGEDTFNESRVLVTHLFRRPRLLEEGLLEIIADVHFIPCAKVSATLCRIYPARGQPREGPPDYIAFREGVPESHENIVWTTAHMLPDWANPFGLTKADVCEDLGVELETYRERIAAVLGVSREPTVDQIVAHTRNVVSKTERPYRHMEELTAFLKVDVMKSVYRFLQGSCMADARARELLESMHCVIVDTGYTFVKPNQVVIDLYEDDQIVPYLYKLPTELGEFKNLFMYLGSTLTASADQYAMVLERMYEQTGGEKLHPNEMRTAFKAVRELFATLQRLRGETLMTTQLYLPSSSGRLVQSSELVYNNDPTYTDRIRNFDRPFLVDLRECKVSASNYEDMIALLPSDLRPAMLTAIVREKMESRSRATIVSYGISEKLRHQLNSRAFSLGVIRLIRHEHHRSGQPRVKQDLLDSIQEQLKKIRVYGVEKLVTYLSFRSVRIDGSESDSECFVERAYSHEEGDEIWHIYVDNKMASLNEELLVSVAEVVNRIVGGLLRNSVHYLQPILSSAPHAISRVLDRLKIRPDHSVDFHQPTLPTPGSFVPIEDHHLLKDDFAEFVPGEYVGYELGDDETTGEPTILYATILEQVLEPSSYDERGGALFTQRYRINVGEEHRPVVAYATDLYKFHRVDGFVSRNTSVNSAPSTPRTPTSSAFTDSAPPPTDATRGSTGAAKRPSSTAGAARKSTSDDGSSTKRDDSQSRRDDVFDANKPTREDTNGYKATSTEQSWRRSEPRADVDAPTAPTDYEDYGNGQKDIHGGYRDMYFREEDEQTEQEQHSNGFHEQQQQQQQQQQPPEPEEQRPQPPDAGIDDENATLDDIMNDVSDKLEEAWRLPEKQRKKIIKRLLLKWHPDKNIGAEKLATVVMQHIQGEIDRLVQGLPRPKTFENFEFDLDPRNPFAGSSTFKANFYNAYQFYFEQTNQRAKEHREQRERYKENFSREYSARGGYNFDVPPSFSSSNPQPAQAKRFLRQAQEDLRSADNDYEVREPAYEWVCFKAHQAAEKALKAAQFSVDAVTSFSHDLTSIAATLEDLELRRLATKLQSIVGDSGKLYNPDPIDFVVIPHDEYTMEMACDAVMCSADILERVKEFVQIRD